MGYRLDGSRLAHAKGYNIVSDGIANGAIQIPGNGVALVLLADPRHHRRLSQDRVHRDRGSRSALHKRPSAARFGFEAISVEAAQTLARGFADAIARLARGLHTDWSQLSSEALLAVNLAGEAVDALDEPPAGEQPEEGER